jgi:dTDP-4-amino-4,6-dideoxygalactose transaminase
MTVKSMPIPFHLSWSDGTEIEYIQQALFPNSGADKVSFTQKALDFFEKKYSIKNAFLTKSCTDALEMASILMDLNPGDEIIIPSFTFVSTANPFVLRGAKIVFADSESDSPNIDVSKIESLITKKTRAILPVHYGGVACDMEKILELAKKYNLFVLEDAAHSIDGFYKDKPLGTIGNIGTFSFHSTKNITCNEGGLMSINDTRLLKRAQIIFHKGTNRTSFELGEVKKYEWVDVGSSYQLSDVLAAYLYAQLQSLDFIQSSRKIIWNRYFEALYPLHIKKVLQLPFIPSYATHNAHVFYFVCNTPKQRESLINVLKQNNIQASFHYQSLHQSPYFQKLHDGRVLPNADNYSNCLLRLPVYPGLANEQIEKVIEIIYKFYNAN